MQEATLECELTIDGSRTGTHEIGATTGFAICQVIRQAATKQAMEDSAICAFDTMPVELPVQQTSGRAELYAFYFAIRNSCWPGKVYSEYMTLLAGLRNGAA